MLTSLNPEQVGPPSKGEVCEVGGGNARPAGSTFHPTDSPPPHFTGSRIVAFLVALLYDALARSFAARGLRRWGADKPVFLRSPVSAQSLGLFFNRLCSLQARAPPLLSV